MKRIRESLKYQLELYFKGSICVAPFVAVITLVYMIYSSKPVGVVESFSVTCSFLFLIMVWVGYSVSSSENSVMEQIQFLYIHNNFLYYFTKILFISVLGLLMSALCLGFPVLQNAMNHSALFTRQLTGYDLLNGFILFDGCAFAGGALGSILHPRVMKDRRMAIGLTLLFALLTIAKVLLVRTVPSLQFIVWIFPPIDKIAEFYGEKEYFQLARTGIIFLRLFVYGMILNIIKSLICYKKRF